MFTTSRPSDIRVRPGLFVSEPSYLPADQMKHIDPHVHCRDWDEAEKATIKEVMQLARRQGIVAIIDMPNTKPAIINGELVDRRLATAREQGSEDGYYLYIGATSTPDQIREAVRLAKYHPKVAGIKMYAGKSTNNLSIIDEEAQKMVYQILVEMDYKGAIAVHCEKESLSHYDLWVPERPATWNLVKPPEAEVESVRDQIKFAEEAGFKGHLHICHTSVPESIILVNEAKQRGNIRISCCATPHHLTLSTDDDMEKAAGVRYKVNPPIRSKKMMLELMDLLRIGKIDWIETDHAPHKDERDKIYIAGKPRESYASGIRSLEHYKGFIADLKSKGFTREAIERLTYSNIKSVFHKITE